MKLNHYTLSQLLTTYSRDHVIRVSVEHAGAPDRYNVELDHEKTIQVREVGWRIGRLLSPSEEEVVAKRLYKMRFVESAAHMGQKLIFEASVRDTKIVVIVMDPKISTAEPDAPCMSLDLSPKTTHEPVQVVTLSDIKDKTMGTVHQVEPQTAANEDSLNVDRAYELERIVDQYSSRFVYECELKFEFSRVKPEGLEECKFVCSPRMEVIAGDISFLRTSASHELCEVFDALWEMKFIPMDTFGKGVAAFIATKGDTTVRVTAQKVDRITPVELSEMLTQDPAVEVVEIGRPEVSSDAPVNHSPTMKETFISWLRKILS